MLAIMLLRSQIFIRLFKRYFRIFEGVTGSDVKIIGTFTPLESAHFENCSFKRQNFLALA